MTDEFPQENSEEEIYDINAAEEIKLNPNSKKPMGKITKLLTLVVVFVLLFGGIGVGGYKVYKKLTAEKHQVKQVVKAVKKEKYVPPAGEDTLVLKNGGRIQGNIKMETDKKIVFAFEGGTIDFFHDEIAEIRRGNKLVYDSTGIEMGFDEGAAAVYPRVYLQNGTGFHPKSTEKKGGDFYFEIEDQEPRVIPIEEIQSFYLWPPPEADKLPQSFKALKKDGMEFYDDVMPYAVMSSVEPSDYVLYKNALQNFYHDFVIHFYELLEFEGANKILPVVIYGNYDHFLSVGRFPQGTNIQGYFIPDNGVLHLYNVREKDVYKYFIDGAQAVEDEISGYSADVVGNTNVSSAEKWAAFDYYNKAQEEIETERIAIEFEARTHTIQTLRHEAGHQLLSLFGLDSADIYRGAWFSEGFADYVSPVNMGEPKVSRLLYIRWEKENGYTLMPLEKLTSFSSGSGIHDGLSPGHTLLAYAQSWAFIHFLMENYREEFFSYVQDLKTQSEDFDAEEDKRLLQIHLKKTFAELEEPFQQHVNTLLEEYVTEEAYDNYRYDRLLENRGTA